MTLTKNQIISHIVVALVIYVLVYLFFFSCNPQPVSVAETKNTEIKYKNKLIEVSKKEDIATIAKMRKIIDSITLRQLQSPKDKQRAKEFLKTHEKGEIGTYLTTYYKVTDITTTNNGTEIGDNTGYKIVSNLIDLDFCQRDFKDLMVKYNALDKTNSAHYNLWRKTDTIANNNYQMYVNDSTALANVKEAKFRLSAFGMYGNNTTLTNSDYKGGIIVNDKKNRSYIIAVGRDVYYLGFGVKIFEVKGKIKN